MTAFATLAHCRRIEPALPAIAFADLAGFTDAPADQIDEPPLTGSDLDTGLEPLPPDLQRAALLFTRAIVEGLCGRRGAAQFGDLVSPRVVAMIVGRAASDRLQPLKPASMRVQLVTPQAAEVAVRVVRDGLSSAIAFRLDHRRGAWRCTAIAVGP